MTISVDQGDLDKAQGPGDRNKAKVLFVTDPLCSWCWGTLPELLKTQQSLKHWVSFDLIMGGLQIGTPEGLLGYDVKRLNRLWTEVAETTGQTFSGKIPKDFIYHSEMSCRAVELARELNDGLPPFEFFHQLQAAFYLEGKDINDPEVLSTLLKIPTDQVARKLASETLIQKTRQNFDYAKSLSANALPHFLIDTGAGYQLLCGGYVTEEFLVKDILFRIGDSND